ncbi:uncharacterized protein [Eurosta solidaginis]|uniref:uncharacterized protein n=1 Tax=Eurosta solidaginis TaxID=178769 RepID=UPI0035314F08
MQFPSSELGAVHTTSNRINATSTKMAIIKSCCFWKTVRKGSMASATYTLVYFAFSALVMFISIYDEIEFLSGNREQPVGESILARGEITPAIVLFNILFLICSVCLVLSSLLVLLALKFDRRELLLPWIVFMLCDVLIELIHLIYLSIKQIVNFDPIVGFIFTIDFFIMCLNSYCLLCVISQYQNYLQGRGYGDQQTRREIMLQQDDNGPLAQQIYLRVTNKKNNITSPCNNTNALLTHTISTIPEEMEQNQKSADEITELAHEPDVHQTNN